MLTTTLLNPNIEEKKMGKSGKKPRKKLDARNVDDGGKPKPKKENDWSFDDIARSKLHRR